MSVFWNDGRKFLNAIVRFMVAPHTYLRKEGRSGDMFGSTMESNPV